MERASEYVYLPQAAGKSAKVKMHRVEARNRRRGIEVERDRDEV